MTISRKSRIRIDQLCLHVIALIGFPIDQLDEATINLALFVSPRSSGSLSTGSNGMKIGRADDRTLTIAVVDTGGFGIWRAEKSNVETSEKSFEWWQWSADDSHVHFQSAG